MKRILLSMMLVMTVASMQIWAQQDMNLQVEQKEIFKVVEDMPRFPGCEDSESDNTAKRNCANNLLLQYVYKNLRYPAEAKKAGLEGMSVVSFVINEEGEMEDLKVVRNRGYGIGQASMDVFEKMRDEITWIPGKQRGRTVAVQFTLPIKFKLERSKYKKNDFYLSDTFLDDFMGVIMFGNEEISFEEFEGIDLDNCKVDLVVDPQRAKTQYKIDAPGGMLYVEEKGMKTGKSR